jgi:hypothetical protein
MLTAWRAGGHCGGMVAELQKDLRFRAVRYHLHTLKGTT